MRLFIRSLIARSFRLATFVRRFILGSCICSCVLDCFNGYSLYHPDEAWRGYYDDGYLSKFFRSGITAVSDFVQHGFMESGRCDQ